LPFSLRAPLIADRVLFWQSHLLSGARSHFTDASAHKCQNQEMPFTAVCWQRSHFCWRFWA